MLKRFFISFLGSLAGICVAGFILFVGFFSILALSAKVGGDQKVDVKEGSVLHIELSGSLVDRQMSTPIIDMIYASQEKRTALDELLEAIEKAKTDDNIEGIFLDCGGMGMGMAQMNAIMDALKDFKTSDKWIYAYGDNYTQGDYYLASVADSVFVNPIGMIDVHGLSSTTLFFKNFLDKVGVDVQVVKVGTYKSAVEPFLLSDISEPNRLQLSHFLGQMWGNIALTIAQNRSVDTTMVNKWADEYCFTLPAEEYIKYKLADKLAYRHEVESMLANVTDQKKKPRLVDVDTYSAVPGKKKKGGANIAVLYAVGEITESGKDGIASDRIVPEILKLAENKKIDGLILRVNSPGGSAFASEQIWEALQQYKKISGKPFYVSMGDYAASGGYYISCGADKIYADPLTLTGSIGIYGMIPDAQNLLNDKLGINTATVATNKTEMPGFFKAMSPDQRAAMQGYVNRGYELFVSRCAAGRHISVDSIKAIAEGRVWDGASALEIGLVDHLGNLDDAIKALAEQINSESGKSGYMVKSYPDVKMQWWDEILELNGQISEKLTADRLGCTYEYYKALKGFAEKDPLQCHMGYFEVK